LRGAATPPRPSSFSRGFTPNPAPAPRSPSAAMESQQTPALLPASGTRWARAILNGVVRHCSGSSIGRLAVGGALALAQVSALGCAVLPGFQRPAIRGPSVPAAANLAHREEVAKAHLDFGGEEDFVVRIVAPATTCSGTLIAEDLVLTAHHCVSMRDGSGRLLPADLDPDQLTVEVGSGHFPWAELPIRAIVSPGCGHAAGVGDLAILVLSKRLRGVRVLPPALDREPVRGDEVSHIGFGRCALSDDGVYLKHRSAGRVDSISKTGFRVNVPLCPGDSGGPVLLHASRVLIGVVSAGAMDGDESTPDRVEFARLDPFRALFANAARVAAGSTLSELPPVDCPTRPE
ncbi:MAG TPA: S1 family peptidase, partial [Polyangiaceae bacterium]|nr:S1 family peptidase [Polyangiaceae bacterium]